MKFENKLIEERWKDIIKNTKQKKKVLIGVITSEANAWCQSQWFGHVLYIAGYFDVVIFENSDTIENYTKLKFLAHNYPNLIVKRGKFGIKRTMDKIVANRNLVLRYAKKYDYDNVIMLDSDVFPPVDLIPTFLKRDLGVQCSLCSIMPDGRTAKPACNFFPEDIPENAPRWIKEKKPRLVKIAQSGLGCVMFKCDIFRKHKDLKFINKVTRKNGKTWHNEDLYFTGQIREKGYDLWLDLRMESPHMVKKRA